MGPFSDERLARRAADGDRRAFDAIYRRYRQPLYRFCLALVGNREDAQDALQNTMVKVLRALPGEQRTIELRPWLYRIARNESVEVLRRRRPAGDLETEPGSVGDVAEEAEARERLRRLLADLGQLPERQRAVLVMRELSGLEFAEIGAALGTSAAVARQALYEARLSLRQLERGREMRCTEVMRELSDGDGRITRRREIRSHLRSCADCRTFGEEIGRRRNELAAIAPLPLPAALGILKAVLGTKAGAGASAGAGAGASAVATPAVVKSVATIAVATVVGVSAADRGGLIDVPLPLGAGEAEVAREAPPAPRPAVPPTRVASSTPNARGALGRASARDDRGVAIGGAAEVGARVDVPVVPGGMPEPGPSQGSGVSGSPSAPGGRPQWAGAGAAKPATGQSGQHPAAKRPSQAGRPSDPGRGKALGRGSDPGRRSGRRDTGPPPAAPALPAMPKHPPEQQPGPPPHSQAPSDAGEAAPQSSGQGVPGQKSDDPDEGDELP